VILPVYGEGASELWLAPGKPRMRPGDAFSLERAAQPRGGGAGPRRTRLPHRPSTKPLRALVPLPASGEDL